VYENKMRKPVEIILSRGKENDGKSESNQGAL
jgi:hypothetical protein